MHYSMFIQGSPTNGLFSWINPYMYRNSYITSFIVQFRQNPNKVMFNNVGTNTKYKEQTIPPGYYLIGEVIAILNTTTDAAFSISTKDSC